MRALDGEDDRASGAQSLDFAQRSIARCGNQMESTRFMAMLHRPGGAPRARNSSASQAAVPGARGSRSLSERRRARDPPAHPRAAQIGVAAQPNQKGGHARPLRGDRKPPRRGEIERARVAPQLADHTGEARCILALLHRPQRIAGVARLDMDEVVATEAPADGPARSPGSPSGPAPTAAACRRRAAPAGTPPSRRRAGARRTARTGWAAAVAGVASSPAKAGAQSREAVER